MHKSKTRNEDGGLKPAMRTGCTPGWAGPGARKHRLQPFGAYSAAKAANDRL
jgi:hypothetical protein